jgi:hypothetical protein
LIGVFQLARERLVGALAGLLVAALVSAGFFSAADPETEAQARAFIDAAVMFLFYVVSTLVKSYLEKRRLATGEVLPSNIQRLTPEVEKQLAFQQQEEPRG